MNETQHSMVEAMAASWDEAGYRPPWNWRYVCSCGHTERQLRDQIATYAAWKAHVAADAGAVTA